MGRAVLVRLAAALLFYHVAFGASFAMVGAAPAGLTEQGVPPFVVYGLNSLGLRYPPSDLKLLKDGRILLIAQDEIAIGDGVRWEVYRAATPSEQSGIIETIGVSADGRFYRGMPGGFGKIAFNDRGHWYLKQEATLPDVAGIQNESMPYLSTVGNEWLWHSGGGMVIRWRPGSDPKVAGRVPGDIASLFTLKGRIYYSSRVNGEIGVLGAPGDPVGNEQVAFGRTVQCSVPFDDNHLLLGTAAQGLMLFDGKSVEPFARHGILAEDDRITDLCALGGGKFAAAIPSQGIVFFNREGKVLEVLGRANDRRLAQVQRLRYQKSGVLWALLSGGIARIEFPSRITQFQSLMEADLSYAEVVRSNGRLWFQANGRVERAVYNGDGRLDRLEDKTPDGGYVHCLISAGDRLLATDKTGVYEWGGGVWRLVSDIGPDARLVYLPNRNRIFFLAPKEVGWLDPKEGTYGVTSYPEPDLGVAFGAAVDGNGSIWVERGSGRLARVCFDGDQPTVQYFNERDGLPDYWVSAFIIDGRIEVSRFPEILTFDPSSGRFVPDKKIVRKYPGLAHSVGGRPIIDSRGRLWVATDNAALIYDPHSAAPDKPVGRVPLDYRCYWFTPEADGVVWIHEYPALVRYDPSVQMPATQPVRAIISKVQFTSSGRTIVSPGTHLPTINYNDNSVVVRFMAPTDPFKSPVRFQVRLNGTGKRNWVSTGTSNSAVFNRLKEGTYVFQVRPVVNGVPGEAARFSMTVLPPWYRTTPAYAAYTVAGIFVIFLAIWIPVKFQRHQRTRLEQLVSVRTQELNRANERLGRQVEETLEKSVALRDSEERYRILYEDNPSMYLTLDGTGRILSVNRFGAEQLGYAVDEMVGRPAGDFVEAPDRPAFGTHIEYCLKNPGQSVWWQLRKRHKSGDIIYVKELARAVPQPDGTLVVMIVCENITAQVKLEEQLRQSQKMDALGQLAGGVAHDFNNLLTVIIGYAELCDSPDATPEEISESIAEIRDAAQRASNLTRQLLVFSHQQAMKPIQTDLNDVVENLSKMLKRVIGEDIVLRIQHSSEPLPVYVDPGMIGQVLVNMAVNARDAMPHGGVLNVRTATVTLSQSDVDHHPNGRTGVFHCLEVRDNGHGIPSEIQSRIFEAFFTTKPAGRGTGLGLATSQSIVNQHRGWIEVTSGPDEGTVFSVYLPHGSREPAAVFEEASRKAELSRGSGNILIVEDEPSVRGIARRILAKNGYTVYEAENGDAALEVWREYKDVIDLVLTDILMPGKMMGRELAQVLHGESPSLEVCFMTGHDPAVLAEKMESGEAAPVDLQKPFTADQLLSLVRDRLKKRSSRARERRD